MRKINFQVDSKDRVICVSVARTHEFYYEPYKSNEQLFLFEKDYSPSIYSYFKDYGVCLNGIGYSLTLKQLHEHREKYNNHKIKEVLERIPSIVQHVLKERDKMQKEQNKNNNTVTNADEFICEERELVA